MHRVQPIALALGRDSEVGREWESFILENLENQEEGVGLASWRLSTWGNWRRASCVMYLESLPGLLWLVLSWKHSGWQGKREESLHLFITFWLFGLVATEIVGLSSVFMHRLAMIPHPHPSFPPVPLTTCTFPSSQHDLTSQHAGIYLFFFS